jgi:outer membrane lipoprotein-sorting protein
MKTKLVLTLLLAITATSAYTQSAEDIISKYLLKIGGIDKWKSVKSQKMIGILNMQGVDLPITAYAKPLAMKRLEIKVPGVEIIQTYNGKEGWMLNPQMGKDPVKLTDDQSKEFAEDEFEDKFIDYKKKGHEATLLGTEEVDGIKCFKIQLIKNKNNDLEDIRELHFFDAETYFPVLEIGYKSREEKVIELKEYKSDYREVNGLMFSFYQEDKIGDQTIQKLTIEKIILNESIDDSLFTLAKK